jgi:predicted O-linked N-acetylglucosamine transferase (SPINDLY family)
VKNVPPEKLKGIIQEDKIDILFDMSAHTGDNRLDTFVLKPAPIQMTWCGYPNSSGIDSMDYRLVDRYVDSEKSQKYYVEKFIYMPDCFLAYSPSMGIENIPKLVEKQPCAENKYITFGSFNRFNKCSKLFYHSPRC